MAISKLSELQTAITDRLGRTDFTSAQTLECINMAEARIMRELRTLDMETKTDPFSITGQYVAVPTLFGGVRAFYITTNGVSRTLTAMSPEQILNKWGGQTGVPEAFAVVDGNFMFGPTPSGTYSAVLVYFLRITPLVSANDTNWLFTNSTGVDAYLYGAMREAAVRLDQFDRAQAYEAMFQQAIDGIRRRSNNVRFSGPAMAITSA